MASKSAPKRKRSADELKERSQARAAAAASSDAAAAAAAEHDKDSIKNARKRRRKDMDSRATARRRAARQQLVGNTHTAVTGMFAAINAAVQRLGKGIAAGVVQSVATAATDAYGAQRWRPAAAAAAAAAAADADADGGDDDSAESDAESGSASDESEDMCGDAAVHKLHEKRMRSLTPFGHGVQVTAEMKAAVAMRVWSSAYATYCADGTTNSLHGAVADAARYFHTGTKTVRTVVRELDPQRLGLYAPVLLPAGVQRKQRTDLPANKVQLTDEQVAAARAFVSDQIAKGGTITYGEITKHLGGGVSVYVVRRRLIELNFKVMRVRHRPAIDFAEPYWVGQFERYVVQWAQGLEEERYGTGVCVYIDESFCHQRHGRWQTVVDGNDPTQVITPHKSGPRASVPTGGEKGKLVIIVHAITSAGLVAERHDDGTIYRPPVDKRFDMGGIKPSAELVYAVGSPPSDDYHDSLNGASFISWIMLRLFPGFWRQFGRKRMYLILDNCKVHSTRPAGFVAANKSQTKANLAAVLRANGVASVPAENKHGKYNCLAKNYLAKQKDGGCTQPFLLEAVKKLYGDKPELCFSDLQKFMREGVIRCEEFKKQDYAEFEAANYHRIVHTVPYNSAHNPIEIIWSAVKGHVAQQHTADRTTDDLIAHIREGFYGTADGQWEGVTAQRCQNAIAHAKGVASALIRSHPRLRACYAVGTKEQDMHIDSFDAQCRERYGAIALSRDAAAFANGQEADFGGDAPDQDANYEWDDDGGDDAVGLAD